MLRLETLESRLPDKQTFADQSIEGVFLDRLVSLLTVRTKDEVLGVVFCPGEANDEVFKTLRTAEAPESRY